VSMAHGYMQFTAFLKGSADLTFVLSWTLYIPEYRNMTKCTVCP
jgi:hypothetical protein